MKTLLTLDYELFFGPQAGTVRRCMLEPVDAVRAIARETGVRFTFFVDCGFLIRMKEDSARFLSVQRDFDAVRAQLEALAREGHDLQLHIHSHWEDSCWSGDRWHVDARRFRLQDFEPAAISEIVARYVGALYEFVSPEVVVAFRAGGWVVQPFERIATALKESGIRIDSSVFPGGVGDSQTHKIDFRGAPDRSAWRFSDDPLRPDDRGWFVEIPIASQRLSPWFYWRFARSRYWGGARHRAYGDGVPLPLSRSDILRRFVRRSYSVVSMDGLRADLMKRAYDRHRAGGRQFFVVIGHPKALTPYSLDRLESLCREVGPDGYVTYPKIDLSIAGRPDGGH